MTDGSALKLDLTDVTYADANGVSALFSLKSRGAIVTNCSPFLEEQLKSPVSD
jgi:anti-anti-sigma regulatory factor